MADGLKGLSFRGCSSAILGSGEVFGFATRAGGSISNTSSLRSLPKVGRQPLNILQGCRKGGNFLWGSVVSSRQLSGQVSCLRRGGSDVRMVREERAGHTCLFGGAGLLVWDFPDDNNGLVGIREQCRVMMRLSRSGITSTQFQKMNARTLAADAGRR
jgi:hypothetical protein